MLFNDIELRSNFEFDCDLPDSLANLNALTHEVYRVTQLLYTFWKNKKAISFHCTDNNNMFISVEFEKVSEKTWYRDMTEIKEILYRSEHGGKSQEQFSLNKGLKQFNIIEPSDYDNYKRYLQLLYFFYIMNYFAFPKKNIFKLLKKENMDYCNSYDEGVENGKYLTFILSNLLSNSEVLNNFIYKTNELSRIMNLVSTQILSLDSVCNHKVIRDYLERIIIECSEERKEVNKNNILDIAVEYCNNYSMYSYSVDLLNNLEEDDDLFHFEKLNMRPFSSWKQKYILLEELEDFLFTDEVYKFCKQSNKKVEVREKLKFRNSNSVKFLKQLIEYDKKWIADFNGTEVGLLVRLDDGKMKIYALKLAVIIKTYDDLTNKMRIRLNSGNRKKLKPLRSVLLTNWNFEHVLPATLGVRFFLLAAHSQYQNAITDGEYYSDFMDRFLFPEILVMKMMRSAYCFNTIDESINFLTLISKKL